MLQPRDLIKQKLSYIVSSEFGCCELDAASVQHKRARGREKLAWKQIWQKAATTPGV